jgi:alpha-beta hydrolase superfamily lysophospholipase
MAEAFSREYNGHRLAIALHDTGSKEIVIFCHGYRSSSIGPNRFFVRAADKLAAAGISSLRFDQYGSGNSDGSFLESSFDDWVATAKSIAQDYLEKGYRVSLFGQSMGGSTVLVAGADTAGLTSVVAWVPDASVDAFEWPSQDYVEELGQRVSPEFWQQAYDANITEKLSRVKAPALIVQCTADEYVDAKNRDAIAQNAQSNHLIETYQGLSHSTWTYQQSEEIIIKSVNFIEKTIHN